MVKTFKEKVITHKEFEIIPITELVRKCISQSGITEGLVFVITAHTSSGIMVNENLPCLMTDIEETLERLVPVMVIENGKLECGKAQDVYFAEFDGPQTRNIFIQIQGE